MAIRHIITGDGFSIARYDVPYVLLHVVRGLLTRRPPRIRVRCIGNGPYTPDFAYDCECGQTSMTDLEDVADHVLSEHGKCSFDLEAEVVPKSGRVPQPGREAEGA